MTQRVTEAVAAPQRRGALSPFRDLLELDLAAFSVPDSLPDDLAPAQARPAARSPDILRRSKEQISARTIERGAQRKEAGRTIIAAVQTPARKITQAKAAGKAASRAQLQAEPSRNVRTEPARASCKERPKSNKGDGGSRAFVPWCDRKR